MSSPYTPHPWNQDFAWRPATSTPAALTPEQTEAFNRQGFFVMEDLLDPAAGPATGRVACDDPNRQYPVVRSRRPVSPDRI